MANPIGVTKSNVDFDSQLTSPRNFIGAQFMSDPSRTRANGQLELLMQIALLAGFNIVHQINDAETVADWTESDSGTLDITADTSDTRVIPTENALLITATAACNSSQYIETRLIDGSTAVAADSDGVKAINMEDTQYIGFWQRAASAGDFGTAGELQVALVYKDPNDGQEKISSKASVPAATVDVHQRVEIDLTALTDADGNALARDKIVALRFYCNNANAAEAVAVEEIIRYLFGNGRGPVQGACEMYPIVSGQTVARGDIMSIEPGPSGAYVRTESGADQGNTRGVAVIGGTGVAAQTVFATVQAHGPVYLRANEAIAAELGVEWATGNEVDGNDAADIGVVFGKALEAAGAALDDFLVDLATNSNEG